jgi:predicted metal-dependent hydrolase
VVPLEKGGPSAEGALEDATALVAAARSEGVDVRQAERLLRQAQLALQMGNLKAAARLAEAARRSVRNALQRAAYIKLAFGKLEADIKALNERGSDTSQMEIKLAEARAVRTLDPALSRALFADAVEGVVRARRELADKKKKAFLKNLPK